MLTKNKGFVIFETIIVISVLLIGMILLYSNYNKIFTNSGKISYYDNVEDMYTAYYVYINRFTINTTGANTIEVNSDDEILNNLGINKIYFINKETFLNLYDNDNANCQNLDSINCFDGTTIAYLKSIQNKTDVDKCESNENCLTIVKIERDGHYYFAKYEAYNVKQPITDDNPTPNPDPITPDVPDVPEITQKIYNYNYTGNYQTFTAPIKATYQIELWGAKGGGTDGGKGGYVKGNIELEQGETIYIYVGGQGDSNGKGGYNGGGNAGVQVKNNDGGGGATDIRLEIDNLNSRIMVAGGGGGANANGTNTGGIGKTGGAGGGISGIKGISKIQAMSGLEGTQVSGGTAGNSNGANGDTARNRRPGEDGKFGVGGNGTYSKNTSTTSGGAGGGGGYYGGGSGEACMESCGGSGGGGSSYISGHTGCVAIKSSTESSTKTGCTTGTTTKSCSVHYSNKEFTDTLIIDGEGYKWTTTKGDLEQMPNPSGGYYGSGTGNSGDGYARITIPVDGEYAYIAPTSSDSEPYYKFTVQIAGDYKLETWSAQGGTATNGTSTYTGGYGGYSVGIISLNVGESIYIYVGGAGNGSSSYNTATALEGGYNGGGKTSSITGKADDHIHTSGGGATHIAFQSGLLKNLNNNINNIIVVSGAGGGAFLHKGGNAYSGDGGSAGGYIGSAAVKSNGNGSQGLGGTQTEGGKCNPDHANCKQALSTIFGSFGLGGVSPQSWGSSGGAGLYGGGASNGDIGVYGDSGGGGGSSYIGNSRLFDKSMYCYNCTPSSDNSTKTISTTCHSATATTNCAKEGNGYAKITYMGKPTNLG